MTLTEAAARAIDLAYRVREYYAVEYPRLVPTYPFVTMSDPVPPPPPEEEELEGFLSNLPEPVLRSLMLVMYLGRWDFRPAELAANAVELEEAFPEPGDVVARMVQTGGPLADCLSRGLEMLRAEGIEADGLPAAACG